MNESVYYCRDQGQIAAAVNSVAADLAQKSYQTATGEHQGYEIIVQPITTRKRSISQNNALWLWAEMCATMLNGAGLDQRKVLNPEAEIPWTKTAFVDAVWRPVQKALFGTDSTRQLSKIQPSEVETVIRNHIAKTQGFDLPPWPTSRI